MSDPLYKNQITIPNEILMEIFNHLDLQSLINAGKVCKRWRSIVNLVHEKAWSWRSLAKAIPFKPFQIIDSALKPSPLKSEPKLHSERSSDGIGATTYSQRDRYAIKHKHQIRRRSPEPESSLPSFSSLTKRIKPEMEMEFDRSES